MRVLEMASEMPHDSFIAVYQNRTAGAGPAVPLQQFSLVGMGGESADGVNFRADGNLVAEESHLFNAVDNVPRQSTFSGIPHEDDTGLRAAQVIPEMVTDPPSSAHPGASHNDRATRDVVNGLRFR